VVQPEETQTSSGGAQILDLTELLQRSLKKNMDKKDEKPPARAPAKAGAENTSSSATRTG
jgi:DNA end-binding protein Ku